MVGGLNVLGGERREGEAEIGQGGAAERKGESGQRADGRRTGREGGRAGEEVKGWKNVGILQQSGWCEGGRVRNVAGNAGASSVCKKPHCNISHP